MSRSLYLPDHNSGTITKLLLPSLLWGLSVDRAEAEVNVDKEKQRSAAPATISHHKLRTMLASLTGLILYSLIYLFRNGVFPGSLS